jgi:predicted phage terminase large subunit-like protein
MWDSPSYPPFDYVIASIDTAYTAKTENDPSAMTVWGIWSGGDQTAQITRTVSRENEIMAEVERTYKEGHPKCMLIYAWNERLEFHDLIDKVQETMEQWGVEKLLVEAKASGISVAQELRRVYNYDDVTVQLVNPKSLDKVARVYSIQHLFAGELVYAPNKSWADAVINQAAQFPRGKHDDLVDSTSMALRHMRDAGLLVRNSEWSAELDQDRTHVGAPPPPLYPV